MWVSGTYLLDDIRTMMILYVSAVESIDLEAPSKGGPTGPPCSCTSCYPDPLNDNGRKFQQRTMQAVVAESDLDVMLLFAGWHSVEY